MNSHKQTVLIETAGDNVYYNVTFTNQNLDEDYHPIPMVFSETRTTPLLPGETDDYKMSVVKFEIPTNSIPLQLFPTKTNSLSESTYSVTLLWNGFYHQVFLEWDPENIDATPPQPPYDDASKDAHPDYYAMYNVEHFMRIINLALSTAHGLLALDGAPVNPAVPPFLYYDPVDNLISLYAPIVYNSDNPMPINIYFNNELSFNFERSFPSDHNSFNDLTGQDLQILVHNNIINQQTIGGNQYYVMTQEYQAIVLMLDVASIVLTSNSLPLRNEWVAIQGLQENSYLSMISDYHIAFTTGNELKNRLYYLPTAQYRYATLTSTIPIQTIDLQFYWRSVTGKLYPIYLSVGDEGSVKILFEKK